METCSSSLDKVRSLDELVKYLCSSLNAHAVLVTEVTSNGQFVLANSGLQIPSEFQQSLPLSHSICLHTVAMDFPLVVDDAVAHPLLKNNLVHSELNIGAYLGAPIHRYKSGEAFGTLCALETKRRRWDRSEIELIISAARVAESLYENRKAVS